jgi:hypothetical protein
MTTKTIELKKLATNDGGVDAFVADLEKREAADNARWTDSFAAGGKAGQKTGVKTATL